MLWRKWLLQTKKYSKNNKKSKKVQDGQFIHRMISMIVFAAIMLEGVTAAEMHRNFETLFSLGQSTSGPSLESGPYFETKGSAALNVTGLVGKTVHLVCRVKNLGNRTVSWIRHRDIHLLTVGPYTYTSDQRFEALHAPAQSEEWTLRIRYLQRKDTGIYECQISTTPPIGYAVSLTIVEPITEIAGATDLFINRGSTINLTCLVKNAPEPPITMIWSHNRQAINFDSPRGGISLVTEKGPVSSSRLLIQKALQKDSGLYTCTPSNAHPNSVRVHVLNEEHPAAMHHGTGHKMSSQLPLVVLFYLSIILQTHYIM